nr:TPA_asm: cytochrome c oxidase subunit II [Pseudomyrmex flavicornis]
MNTWLMGLQNSNSPVYDMMIFFHDFTMMILTFITVMIFLVIMSFWSNSFTNRYLLEGNFMEIMWTIMPMITLIFIAIPSIKILYLSDEVMNNSMTIKTIGHQWFWSYEYSDLNNMEFDSFMIPYSSKENFRLLDVDNRCVMPMNYPIRMLTSSTDVIHSWTVPSLGVKMDSTPGRLNQSLIWLNRPGLFFGQCSEICGINHSFMPIVVESTNFKNFKKWVIMNSA